MTSDNPSTTANQAPGERILQVWDGDTCSWHDVTPEYYAERLPSNRRILYTSPIPSPISDQAAGEPSHCMCPACKDGLTHASDCSVHNAPALPVGPCDCGADIKLTNAEIRALRHEDGCRFHDDEEFCTCGAEAWEVAARWRSRALAVSIEAVPVATYYFSDSLNSRPHVELNKNAPRLKDGAQLYSTAPTTGSAPVGCVFIQEADLVPHVHPEYGSGVFCTEDCVNKLATPPANAPVASVLSDAELSAIDTAACEWTDDWSGRQELTPSKEACNAMFIRRVIALLAASMGGDKS